MAAVSGTLYTYPENFRAYKALIAAQYSGAKVKIDDTFKFGVTNKSEDFISKFPLGKVPAFESDNGECLFESNAISWAVANEQLRGKSILNQAQVVQWMNFADNEILPASCTWVFPILGIMPFNKGSTQRAQEDVKRALGALDKHLLTKTFLVGERISLADIAVACTLLQLFEHVLEPSFREPFPNANRWFITMVNQKELKAVLGEPRLCTKMGQFDNKKFAQVQAAIKPDGPKQEKSDKKADKKAEKKAEKKPEKKPAPKKDEERPPPMKESADPLDALPAGSFDMNDWKRFYSNNDEAKSVPYFWEKFDKENYSIWFGEYKFTDELAKIFMTCNLVGGMFQRLDKMRKNAFGSVCVFGEDNNNTISGVWVWRGHELAFPLCQDWTIDYESYNWRKLCPDSKETKDMVERYFKWVGTDAQGKKFSQGKIFK